MTTAQIVTLVLSSGLLAGITSAVTQFWVARRSRLHSTSEREAQQHFNLNEREAQREHEATLRREADHDSARSTFLPMAQEVERWVDSDLLRKHQDQVGSYYPPRGNAPVLASISDALDRLSSIAYGHPTRAVRIAAGDLSNSIEGKFGEVYGNGPDDPELEDWRAWSKSAKSLIEAIHAHL